MLAPLSMVNKFDPAYWERLGFLPSNEAKILTRFDESDVFNPQYWEGLAYRTDAPRRLKFKGFRNKKKVIYLRGAGGRYAGSRSFGGRKIKIKGKRRKGSLTKSQPLPDIRKLVDNVDTSDPDKLIDLGRQFTSSIFGEKSKVDDGDIEKLFESVFRFHDIDIDRRARALHKIIYNPDIPARRKTSFIGIQDRILRLTNGQLAPKKVVADGTGNWEYRILDIGKRGRGLQDNVLYQNGHYLEDEFPDFAFANTQWRDRRASGPLTEMKKLHPRGKYGADEYGYPGDFIHPLVGKQDAIDFYSEVSAVGLREMGTPKKAIAFYEKDPEHFNLVIGELLATGKKPAPAEVVEEVGKKASETTRKVKYELSQEQIAAIGAGGLVLSGAGVALGRRERKDSFRLDAPRKIRFGKFKGKSFDKRFVIRGPGGQFKGSRKRVFRRKKTRSRSGTLTKAQPQNFLKEIKDTVQKVDKTNPNELIAVGKKFSDNYLKSGRNDVREFKNVLAGLTQYHALPNADRKRQIIQNLELGDNLSIVDQVNTKKWLQEFLGISGGRGLVNRVEIAPGRAGVNEAGVYYLGGPSYRTKHAAFHESAHWLERQDKELEKAANTWRLKRAQSDRPAKLKDIVAPKDPVNKGGYDDDEIAYIDKWIDEYVGKIYYQEGTGRQQPFTEVYSKAAEYFIDGKTLQKLHEGDAEHYHLALGAFLTSPRKLTPPKEQVEKLPEIAKEVSDVVKPKKPVRPVPDAKPPLSSEEVEEILPKPEVIEERERVVNRRERNLIKNLNVNATLGLGGTVAGTGGIIYGARELGKNKNKKKRVKK